MAPILEDRMSKFYKVEHPQARLNVKEFSPNSQSARTIGTYIERLEASCGWKPDVLMVDYLNLLRPNGGSRRGDSSMYEDGKVVSEELRKLSYDLGVPIITAVQCNSSGFNTADIGMQNIAESRGIAHTADFIAGLYQTDDEQVDGVFHMKILKSRLGNHVNLKFQFDGNTMEFTDINDVGHFDGEDVVSGSTQATGVCRVDDVDLFTGELGCP
jgi:replicative DNA helicase